MSREMLDDLREEVYRLHGICRDIYEIWAGSEGIKPVYASEAYLMGLIEQMRDEAKKGLLSTIPLGKTVP